MKVILAGYSKTGTKSMAAAFKTLGYNNYDTVENFYYLHREWMKIFEGKASSDEIRKMFEGVDSVTDVPSCFYWKELSDAFPEAKIVLTIRDEDKWFESLLKQIYFDNKSCVWWFLKTFSPQFLIRRSFLIHQGRFWGEHSMWPLSQLKPHHEKVLRALYRQHNTDVINNAPKGKLLVFKVSEGWQPLCKFLEVDVPDRPFPHMNKAGSNYFKSTQNDELWFKFLLSGAAAPLLMLAVVIIALIVKYIF